MNDLIAYALTDEYVDSFSGGLLTVGDGDFDVAEALQAGSGTIVVRDGDAPLVGLLDVYPALQRSTVPASPVIVSPYERRTDATLRHFARLRSVEDADTLDRVDLIAALEVADEDARAIVATANVSGTTAAAPSAQPAAPATPPAGADERAERRAALEALTDDALLDLAESREIDPDAHGTRAALIDAILDAPES